MGRTTCGYFYDGGRRILYSSTFEHSRECPPPPDRSQGYVWPLGRFEIYTAKADGSDLRRLTTNDAYDAEATVSPDGKRVVFTSTRDGDIELYTMNVDGSDVRRVTRRVGYDGGAFFSPDGGMLVWRAMYPETAADSADYLRLLEQRLVRPSRLELWVARADGSEPRQVTRLGAASFAPYFHPDGRRIIFASNQPEPAEPQLRSLSGEPGRQRARAGDDEPGVRRLPHVQPGREAAGLRLQPQRGASRARRTSSSRTGWSDCGTPTTKPRRRIRGVSDPRQDLLGGEHEAPEEQNQR